ncbi:hypothetical protein SprV_0100111200 [Sparganum proliferum]
MSRNHTLFHKLWKMTEGSVRDDRQKCRAETATSMEQASNFDDTWKLCQIIHKVSGKLATLSDSVRDVNDGFIADNSARVDRWREHFKHLDFGKQPITSSLSSATEFHPSPAYAIS